MTVHPDSGLPVEALFEPTKENYESFYGDSSVSYEESIFAQDDLDDLPDEPLYPLTAEQEAEEAEDRLLSWQGEI